MELGLGLGDVHALVSFLLVILFQLHCFGVDLTFDGLFNGGK